ncbi:hypothetical protein GX408_15535 [bacterium]|nr:hypothetical protein [bacterium]
MGDLPLAEQPGFPDQGWRSLDLSHDWSIEGDMKPDHPAGISGASLPGGVGWYRKCFTADSCTSKHRYITFGKDLSFITVEIQDAQGTRVPTADPLLFFSLAGEGRIAGVANGNPISLEPAQGRQRRAFNGLCQVVLQSTGRAGDIVLTASSLGLPDETLRIRSE